MNTINVYQQYFKAEHVCNGIRRRAALVMLTSESGEGNIRYLVAVTFFPHENEEDFAVSYDDYHETEIYAAKGRRSKKREAEFLEGFRDVLDEMLEDLDAKIFWDEPLGEARRG